MSSLSISEPLPTEQQQQQHQQRDLAQLCDACILGSHILHHHGILDAYGHLSFRHPTQPNVFIMPRNMAPANITSSQRDLVAYNVSDASAVDTNAPPGYIERYIHSEIYKMYPAINSVIHSHANAVVPYSISGVPVRPCFHMAGFLGNSTPVYDIAKHYQPDKIRDLLIRSAPLGQSLATYFSKAHLDSSEPDHAVVLMRGHGYTVVASSIEDCVFRAIYTKENAVIQTASLGLRIAYHNVDETTPQIQYLHDDEIEGTKAMGEAACHRGMGPLGSGGGRCNTVCQGIVVGW